jgi:hypothetical protein
VDRGCWNAVDSLRSGLMAVSAETYDLQTYTYNGIVLLQSSYKRFALQKAIMCGYDTFAFEGTKLYFGNYNYDSGYRYDKFGKVSTCLAFGAPGTLKVYSVVAPTTFTEAQYIDRGNWQDGNFYYYNIGYLGATRTIDSTFINLQTVVINNIALAPAQYYTFALQKAIAGGYDTFAFQEAKLFLGNYREQFRYDKFGQAVNANSFGPDFGGRWVNRVYSTIAPKSYTTAQFTDKGCWQDNDFQVDGLNRTIAAVSDTFIDLTQVKVNDTPLSISEYISYGMQRAVDGGYNTFAMRDGKILFLGNYSAQYRYDKYGPSSSNICSGELGTASTIRVFSALANAPTSTSRILKILPAVCPAAPVPSTPTDMPWTMRVTYAPYKATDYIDRGCWDQYNFAEGSANVRYPTIYCDYYNAPATYIDLRKVVVDNAPLNQSQYLSYALQLAMANNYDTFGFSSFLTNTGFGTFLLLGNYNIDSRRYDKFGKSVNFSEFGSFASHRIYSVVAPSPCYAVEQFLDRGCWYDNDALRPGSVVSWDVYDLQSHTHDGFILPTSVYLQFALQKAVLCGYNTFAFQGSKLYLTNYNNDTDSRYDKFGQVDTTISCPDFGGPGIIRVYSVIAPKTLTAALYKDRGIWQDGHFLYSYYESIRPISSTWIELKNVLVDGGSLAKSNYYNFALQKAIDGGYDTFAFHQNADSSVILYIANYSEQYRYDKCGTNALAILEPFVISDFGGEYSNRVYSTVAPTKYVETSYTDKGCWQDNDFEIGGLNRNITAVSNTYIDLRNVATILEPKNYIYYATKIAIDCGFDTFAFKNNYMLFLGNYGSKYRYSKYGASSKSMCSDFGDEATIRVFAAALNTPVSTRMSTTPTISEPPSSAYTDLPLMNRVTYAPYKLSDYIDRGCWYVGNFEDGSVDTVYDRYYEHPNYPINLFNLNIPKSQYISYCMQKAKENCFDTFGIADYGLIKIAYFGNYNSFRRYDKFGKSSKFASFGGVRFHRIYSVVAPMSNAYAEAQYLDRGCWQDGDFAAIISRGKNRGIRAISPEFFDLRTHTVNGAILKISDYYSFALQKAITLGFDTFAFQNGYMLFLGNYDDEFYTSGIIADPANQSSYRYDKFGRPATVKFCPEFGDVGINHVFSTKAPKRQSLASQYMDRGCWQDINFAAFNPRYSFVERAVDYTFIDASNVSWNDYYQFGIQLAIAGGYNTVAFQGSGLFLGNFSRTFSYNKYGKPSDPTCNRYGSGGSSYINRVYSLIPPRTYNPNQYIDRGCWQDSSWADYRQSLIANTLPKRFAIAQQSFTSLNISSASDCITYAKQKASEGGYTTFGLQFDGVYTLLFLGNNIPTYRYDKYGPSTSTAPLGARNITRVYSVDTPPAIMFKSPTSTPAGGATGATGATGANATTVAKVVIIKRPPGYLGPLSWPKNVIIGILYKSCNYVDPVAFLTTDRIGKITLKVEDLGLLDIDIKSIKLTTGFSIGFQDAFSVVLKSINGQDYPNFEFLKYVKSDPCVDIFAGRYNYYIYLAYGQRVPYMEATASAKYKLPTSVNVPLDYMGVLLYTDCNYTSLLGTVDSGVYDLDPTVKSIEITAAGITVILYGPDPSINFTLTESIPCLSTVLPFETAYFIEVIRT